MARAESPTRSRLVEVAARRLWERSYAGTGVDEICRLANAKKGSFYHFFASKTDLALAAVDLAWSVLREEVFDPVSQTGSPGLDRVTSLIARLDAVQRRALKERRALLGCPFASLAQEMAHQDERLRAALQRVFDGQCQYLQTWLDEASRERQIPAGDNAARARRLLALIEGALLLSKVSGNPDLFSQICVVLPAVASRPSPSVQQGSGVPPELL